MASHASRSATSAPGRKKAGARIRRLRRPAASAGRGGARNGQEKQKKKKWSQRVTRESDALDLKGGVFTLKSPAKIAASLKRSAERSKRRKADPYRSALSMLTFYVNRAGKTLPAGRKKILQQAKNELRTQFGRD